MLDQAGGQALAVPAHDDSRGFVGIERTIAIQIKRMRSSSADRMRDSSSGERL
ncbi:MAG: hypothetical protein R3F33_09310 [Planctomycetota bacterium]